MSHQSLRCMHLVHRARWPNTKAGSHTLAIDWAVELVLQLQAEGRALSAELQQLVPLASVVVWAQQRRQEPTCTDIQTRLACSRATAFRWLPALRRARQGAGRS